MFNKKELIRDEEGKVVVTHSNIIKLGFWGTLWYFTSYKQTIAEMLVITLDFIGKLLGFIVALILCPIHPFIIAYDLHKTHKKRAKWAKYSHKHNDVIPVE